MKKCYACGQRLPLKVGDIVDAPNPFRAGARFRGVVVALEDWPGTVVSVQGVGPIDRRCLRFQRETLSRLHGYFRTTEREPLV